MLVDIPNPPCSNRCSSFPQPPVPTPPPPYQQYPAPAPPYPSPAGPTHSQFGPYPTNQQYGVPGPQPPYTAPPVPQYGRQGYQVPPYAPSYSNYPQANGPPQYGGPGYQAPPQQYGPPTPAPYQPPTQYSQPVVGYGGPQQEPPATYQTPQQQWNATPVPRPPYPQSHRSTPFHQREIPTTPSQQSQPLDYGSEGPKQTPQTPASNHGSVQQGARQGSQSSPATVTAESKLASASSTPRNQQVPNLALAREDSTHDSVSEGQVSEGKDFGGKGGEDTVTTDPETPTPEDEDAQFDWDYKNIFKEPERKETVALAQPLSANFKSTPVPLVQAWSIHVPSISRYARKDNVKEFVRSIRYAPQWSFLQEDPGFSDAPLEGPLIPFSELPAWMAERHRMNATPEPELEQELEPQLENDDYSGSRKRLRSEEPEEGQVDEQDDVDTQIALEASESEVDGPRAKRQKNEADDEQQDEVMGTPTARTPVLTDGRAGTPCFQTDDDAWAPEAGERAASPMDPTEALLASLGVSGAPKPVKQESVPPHPAPNDETQSPQQTQSQTQMSSQQSPDGPSSNISLGNRQSNNNVYANAPQGNSQWTAPSTPQGKPQWSQPANTPQSQPQPQWTQPVNTPKGQPQPQWGAPANAPYGHASSVGSTGPPANTHYGSGPSVNAPYVNGFPAGPPGPPANQPYVNSQYGAPTNPPYGSGSPAYTATINPQYGPPVNTPYGPPNGYQQGPPQQYGPTRHPSYGNGPPYNTPQPYNQQYGPPVNFQQGPPQYPQAATPYGPPNNFQQGPSQYPQQRTASFGNGPPAPGPYGGPSQSSPAQYGPPQSLPYNGYQNPAQHYGGNMAQPPYTNGPQTETPYPNGPPSQPPYGNIPPRQDSGYFSARGSYSNASGPPDLLAKQIGPQNSIVTAPRPVLVQGFDGTQDQPPKENEQPQQSDRRNSDEQGNGDTAHSNGTNSTEDTGTPLSPTSAEILGKLVRKNSSGDGSRQNRKIKRPQPVVADAYRYAPKRPWTIPLLILI